MYCIYCGSEIEDYAKFCPYCGAKQDRIPRHLDSSDENNKESIINKEITPYSRQDTYKNRYDKDIINHSNRELGMKWYFFVVKIQLWLSMLIYFCQAINWFSGFQYGSEETALAVYQLFPSLRIIDKLYSVIMIYLFYLCIKARRGLKNYDESGPRSYMLMCYIVTFLNPVYALICWVGFGMPLSILLESYLGSFIVMIIYTSLNSIYFKKRMMLFKNSSLKI